MSYPWQFPAITPTKIDFMAQTLTSKFTSPFSGKTQTYRYQAGQWWTLTLTFSPQLMHGNNNAQTLSGFLTGLGGQDGTFYMQLPSMFRLSGNVSGSVAANGNDFTLNSGTPTVGLFGADVNRRLVVFTTTGSIFPALPSGSVTINPNSGSLFRLATNEVKWSVDEMRQYGFSFDVIEAI